MQKYTYFFKNDVYEKPLVTLLFNDCFSCNYCIFNRYFCKPSISEPCCLGDASESTRSGSHPQDQGRVAAVTEARRNNSSAKKKAICLQRRLCLCTIFIGLIIPPKDEPKRPLWTGLFWQPKDLTSQPRLCYNYINYGAASEGIK